MSEREKEITGFFLALIYAGLLIIAGVTDSKWILQALICFFMITSVIEIVVMKLDALVTSSAVVSFYLMIITVLILDIFVAINLPIDNQRLLLIIVCVLFGEIGAFLFNELKLGLRVDLLRPFGIERYYLRYFGAILFSICAGCLYALVSRIEADTYIVAIILGAWLIGSIGDMMVSICLSAFKLKTPDETLAQIPGIGYIEIFATPFGGFLNCTKTLSVSLVYCAILYQLIL